jgi:hypothetical protein
MALYNPIFGVRDAKFGVLNAMHGVFRLIFNWKGVQNKNHDGSLALMETVSQLAFSTRWNIVDSRNPYFQTKPIHSLLTFFSIF